MKFIEYLENRANDNTRLRAVLRRSLSHDLGSYVPAFSYVEPFVGEETLSWRRSIYYLVAALWADNCREVRNDCTVKLALACHRYQKATGSSSIENRFIALIDADESQLPHRLRQMVSLLKEYPIDFQALLEDLFGWNSSKKSTQIRWAREYYQSSLPADIAED